MFCLRSYLVLLFLPINASPLFIVSFFILTYLLNRPCVYCSILLLILFVSSCYWSDQCFFDLSSNWFEPRHMASSEDSKLLYSALNDTAAALAGAAVEELKRRVGARDVGVGAGAGATATAAAAATAAADWVAGPADGWARSWMGSWRIPCLEVNIRL